MNALWCSGYQEESRTARGDLLMCPHNIQYAWRCACFSQRDVQVSAGWAHRGRNNNKKKRFRYWITAAVKWVTLVVTPRVNRAPSPLPVRLSVFIIYLSFIFYFIFFQWCYIVAVFLSVVVAAYSSFLRSIYVYNIYLCFRLSLLWARNAAAFDLYAISH